MNTRNFYFAVMAIMAAFTGEVRADAKSNLVIKLANSLWCEQVSKPLVKVTSFGWGGGAMPIEGAKLCFNFAKYYNQLFMSEFWWREAEGEYMKVGMAIPLTANSLEYREAEQVGHPIYPTIKVGGMLVLHGRYLDMTQQGYMKDGELISYSNRFVRTDKFPWLRE